MHDIRIKRGKRHIGVTGAAPFLWFVSVRQNYFCWGLMS